jgi:hypothetical protein
VVIGGAVGGVAVLVLAVVILWLVLRRHRHRPSRLVLRPSDSLDGDPDDQTAVYRPDPFVISTPSPSSASFLSSATTPGSGWDFDPYTAYHVERARESMMNVSATSPPPPMRKGAGRSTPRATASRPVTIVQHTDAVASGSLQPIRIELPPAYTHIYH